MSFDDSLVFIVAYGPCWVALYECDPSIIEQQLGPFDEDSKAREFWANPPPWIGWGRDPTCALDHLKKRWTIMS